MEALLLWIQSQYNSSDELVATLNVNGFINEYHFRKNQILFTPGGVNSEAWFLAQGLITVYTEDNRGQQVISDFCPENNFFFDLESYYFGKPAEYYILALEDTHILSINHTAIRQLYDSDSHFRELCLIVKRQIVDRCHHRINLLAMSPIQRFYAFCEIFPYNRITRHQISQYLRIPYSSLNRIIHNSTIIVSPALKWAARILIWATKYFHLSDRFTQMIVKYPDLSHHILKYYVRFVL